MPETFESCLPIIEKEIQKRRAVWTLDAISWMDWDDVCQNLRIHIANKFHLWKQHLPLANWLAAVIHNQLVNVIRNLYTNFSPVCNKCAAYDGCEGCAIYADRRDNCPLFSHWKKNKESAYNVKLPLSYVYHEQEIQEMPKEEIDMDKAAVNIHEKMELILNPHEFRVYSLLFVNHKTEIEVVDILAGKRGKVKELNKIKQLKKKFVEKVRKLIYAGEIDIR